MRISTFVLKWDLDRIGMHRKQGQQGVYLSTVRISAPAPKLLHASGLGSEGFWASPPHGFSFFGGVVATFEAPLIVSPEAR